MLGIRSWGGRMVGADESTELRRRSNHLEFLITLTLLFTAK